MLQNRSIFRRLFRPPESEFRASWWYDRLAPVTLGLLLVALAGTSFLQSLENITVDLRFRARAPSDPPSSSKVVVVGIDKASLDVFGRWPWPRERHGELCTLLAVADPAVVTFDLLFTERGVAEDDAYFAESVQSLPRVVTGALTEAGQPPIVSAEQRTKPLMGIAGNVMAIPGKESARVPYPELGKSSYFGFVDSEPTYRDGIRRRVPLLLRVGNDVYPSLALQTLLLYWKVPQEQVVVQLGRYIEVPSPEGKRQIPITNSGEIWLNYRAQEKYSQWSYQKLMTAILLDARGETPFPKDAPQIKGNIAIVGQVEPGLSDLGPSPLAPMSPLVLTSVTALNSIFKNDFLRIIPVWPWPILIWLGVSYLTLVGRTSRQVLRALLIPLAVIVVYCAIAWVAFRNHSILLPIAIPVLGLILIQVGKLVTDWIGEIIAERRANAELIAATQARKLLEQELEIAREIQLSTLPREFPPFPDRPEVDVHAIMVPAKYVGGDLYEFFFIDEKKLFFVIGDVSGKGVPAALFMTMTLAVIRAHVIAGRSPAETLRRSNNVLALRNERCTFVTVFCGLLDTETGRLVYSNGGHNPPCLLDGEGGVTFLEAEGTAIGAIEGLEFEERELTFKPGQGLFMYTDGVTEAIDLKEEMFEEERLTTCLTVKHRTFTAEKLTQRLYEQLTTFVGTAPQFDDITAVAIFYHGKNSENEKGDERNSSPSTEPNLTEAH